jgi:putative membrane protein
MAILKLLVGLVVVFLLVVFAIANMQAVAVSFYFYKTPAIPLFVIIFISVLVGVMLAWLLVIGEQLSLRGKVRAKDKRIKELEKELEEVEKRLAKVSPQEEIPEEKKEVTPGEGDEREVPGETSSAQGETGEAQS